MVSGSDGPQGDKALVEAVLRELREAADKWELLVAEAERTTYSADLGDVRAVVNSDGRLIELILDPRVMGDYSHSELADRLNTAFAALREEAEADNAARYGGGLR
jgi:DNA-binding protein YbaB